MRAGVVGSVNMLSSRPTVQKAISPNLEPTEEKERIHLSLCGGMSADAYVLRQVGAEFSRSI